MIHMIDNTLRAKKKINSNMVKKSASETRFKTTEPSSIKLNSNFMMHYKKILLWLRKGMYIEVLVLIKGSLTFFIKL